jgi:hypothetical protein
MESLERWLFGLDTIKDFLEHPFVSLVLNFFTISIFILDGVFLLSWILTSVEESFEIFFKSFFPKEGFVTIGGKESVGSFDNLIELFGDMISGTKDLELILDFIQVIDSNTINSLNLNT